MKNSRTVRGGGNGKGPLRGTSPVPHFIIGKNMFNAQEMRSRIAHLLAKIRREHENVKEIFTSLEEDACKFLFIVEQMEIIYKLRHQSQDLVGDAAIPTITEEPENHSPPSEI